MLLNLPLAALSLAAGAAASNVIALDRSIIPLASSDVLAKRYLDVTSGHGLARRQNRQFESTVQLDDDGEIDMSAWDEETEAACQDSLKRLMIASNPSGACICYNLPSLDTSSGVFEADLRVYRFNEPSGAFQGIPAEDIEVALMYEGATVSPVDDGNISNLSEPGARKRQSQPEGEDSPDLPLLQQYSLVGQINKDRMSDDMSM